ncbi:hypothetical protein H0E87_028693 [Populus deltoides]|uniref:Uncharacterized protein n=1 Tax=Populus deltoides TaxID=3696 RepID=A0A8T2WU23_POPDE|nr:hypothetical protein H0E87_028693 [Populus deltoides]
MKNDVEQARASNMEDAESSAPNKGKVIDVGSDSDIDKDTNNACSNMPKHFEPRMLFDIREDLILLENQLPVSIIWDTYHEINRDLRDTTSEDATWESFLDLITYAFGKHTGDLATFHFEKHKFSQVAETKQSVKGSKHFTDLLRSFMLKGSIDRTYSFNPIKLKYNAFVLFEPII